MWKAGDTALSLGAGHQGTVSCEGVGHMWTAHIIFQGEGKIVSLTKPLLIFKYWQGIQSKNQMKYQQP